MAPKIERSTPPNTMKPIGPYNHITKVGNFITIGAVAGVNPSTGELSGPDAGSQTRQVLRAFETMLASVGSDLSHAIHINVFLKDMAYFEEMNAVYASQLGDARPARTVIAVVDLPKPGALVTMNLTAVCSG